MMLWLSRLVPVVVWAAYLFGYERVSDLIGGYAPLLGLAVVALSAWFWGVVGGLASGVLGFLAVQLRASGLGIAAWQVLDILSVEQAFEFVAYAGTGLVIGWFRQLNRNLRFERAAARRAKVDPLTGALVRAAFEERLREELANAASTGTGLALLFVDLDRFKFVNDTYGHDIGDKLLREIGKALRSNVRTDDLVGRVGGDEFMVALLGVQEETAAGQVARSLVRELGSPIIVDGREVQVSASIGVSLYPRDGHDADTLLRSADAAMYQVKQDGKNSFHFSTVEVRTRVSRRLELERKLRRALPDNQLEVVYQPQVRLGDGGLVGFEALLRWRSPELGMVPPSEFIPVAEEAGLIASIGHWMLRDSAMLVRSWLRQGWLPVRMAVNVSTLQFHQQGFVDTVDGALTDSGIDPGLLEIEVTESVLVRDQELAVKTLRRLERRGVRIALDDFGTGYSSLAYLQRLPIQTLKIDRSFVQGLAPEPLSASGRSSSGRSSHPGLARASLGGANLAGGYSGGAVVDAFGAGPIVEAICAMAHKLGKEMVAEGVETAYQRDFMRRLGVDHAQGYFFARPMQVPQVEQLLRRVTAEAKNGVKKHGPLQVPRENHLFRTAEWPAPRFSGPVAAAALATAGPRPELPAAEHLRFAPERLTGDRRDDLDDLLVWE